MLCLCHCLHTCVIAQRYVDEEVERCEKMLSRIQSGRCITSMSTEREVRIFPFPGKRCTITYDCCVIIIWLLCDCYMIVI